MNRDGLFWVGASLVGPEKMWINRKGEYLSSKEIHVAEDLSYEEAEALCKVAGMRLGSEWTGFQVWCR